MDTRGFAYLNPDHNVYLWSCACGDNIPLIYSMLFEIRNHIGKFNLIVCTLLGSEAATGITQVC